MIAVVKPDASAPDLKGWSFAAVLFTYAAGSLWMVEASGSGDYPGLVYVKESGSGCTINAWDVRSGRKPDSLPLPECPARIFGLPDGKVVAVVTKEIFQEIRLTSPLTAGKPIKLPVPPIKPGNFPAQPIVAGFTKEGRLALVMQSGYPFDDTDNFVYVLKGNEWVLEKTVYCHRFDSCRFPYISGHDDDSLRKHEQLRIWHERQAKNPFIASRKILTDKDENGILSEIGGELTFDFKKSRSVLTFHTETGPDTGATLTFGIELKIDDGEPLPLSTVQCETLLTGKYLLLYRFWGEGIELIDIETGKSIFGMLKFAEWL